jgi:outer membrane lipoprotein-sorting protein
LRLALVLLVCLIFGTARVAPAQESAPAVASSRPALLDSLEAAQRTMRDLSARFTQTKFVPVFEETLASSGHLYYMRPGSLLIRYDAPDTSLLSVRDSTAILYYPDLAQAHCFRVAHESAVSALLLGFGGSFREAAALFRFDEPRDAAGAKRKGYRLLRATPIPGSSAAEDIEEIVLTIDTRRWLPSQTRFRETNGDETLFVFEAMTRNSGLPESLFQIDLPPDTEMLEMNETEAR